MVPAKHEFRGDKTGPRFQRNCLTLTIDRDTDWAASTASTVTSIEVEKERWDQHESTPIHWFGHLPLSMFWHTSNVVLDVVSDVVNFSFFFPRKFWCFKFGVFFSHVNFDVVNFGVFFSRKFWCFKFGVFFSHLNFDVVNLAFFFLT